MKAPVVFCHPDKDSFNSAIAKTVLEELDAAGAEVRFRDLYKEDFSPLLTQKAWKEYENIELNQSGVEADCEALLWCDTLIFIYSTWWYAQPAMLKGWLERVLVPHIAFHMPEGGDIGPGLTHIKRLGVFTTCGASRMMTFFIGAPGKRIILRGIRALCATRCKITFAGHYKMDSSTPLSRNKHLEKISRKMRKFVGGGAKNKVLENTATAEHRNHGGLA